MFPSKDVIGSRDTHQLTCRIPSMQGFRMFEGHRHITGSVHNEVRNLQSPSGVFHIQTGTVLLKVLIKLDVMRHVLLSPAVANEQHPVFSPSVQLGAFVKHQPY